MNPIDRTLEAIAASPVVVCIRRDDAQSALWAARAALDGGVRVIEVTLTTPGALEVITALAADERAVPGAGTVLEPAQAERVAEAGGRFALSPVTDPEVIEAAHRFGLLAVPGASTPGEIVAARRAGARVVKVFPIGPLGGPDFIRAVRGPLPDIPLLPTNGVGLERVDDYFDAGVFAVGVGREIFAAGTVENRQLEAVRERAAAFAAAVEPRARGAESAGMR